MIEFALQAEIRITYFISATRDSEAILEFSFIMAELQTELIHLRQNGFHADIHPNKSRE